jgi:hypothetical protein
MELTKLQLPEFGSAEEIPLIRPEIYRARLEQLRARMELEQLDVLFVYADREHSANLAWCTGFDPRFEEALLVLGRHGKQTLLLGNECIHIVSQLPVDLQLLLCQEFSLMGQDRSLAPDLRPLLKEAGLGSADHCGIAGWKSMDAGRLEVPTFISEAVESISGQRPVNANHLFMSPADGLRIVNEPAQIAFFEYAAAQTSASVLRILRALEPGLSCAKLSDLFLAGGLPHSCHPMLACGSPITNGMASPGNARVKHGDFLTCAFGVWGALTCRAGLMVKDPAEFETTETGRRTWKLIENYLTVVRAWYAALRVGVSAGEVWAAAESARDDSLYTFCVNPGHYLHLDEWVSSPFYQGSELPLPSGSSLQADIIPVARDGGISVNMEDGLVLADADLRRQLELGEPETFRRMQLRRRFMINELGYELHEDVLPLGNIPGVYFPCLLDTSLAVRPPVS